jgi:hypothetical protein
VADKGIPSWPKVTIRLYDAHNGEVKIAGRSHPVVAGDPREAALAIVVDRARQLGRPVKVTAVEEDGSSWPLIVHPDGNVEATAGDVGERKSVWPIILAAGIAFVLLASTFVYLLVIRDSGEPTATTSTSPTLPELPGPQIGPDLFNVRPAPPGWSTKADWSVDIAENSNPVVSADGQQIAFLTRDWKVVVLDPNGKVRWQDEVPENTKPPVFTTIDGDEVLAVQTPKVLRHWAGNGALPVDIKLPDGTVVQFFGQSPLVTDAEGGDPRVIKGGELVPVENQQRFATVLLANNARALMARYAGPVWWSEPGKPLAPVNLQAPKGLRVVDQIVAASPNRIIVLWTAGPDLVVPSINDADSGKILAACPQASKSEAGGWKWVPDRTGVIAAFGECVIDHAAKKTYAVDQFAPLSITGKTIYGELNASPVTLVPGARPVALPANTARPWGVIGGGRALVMHTGVLYALAPAGPQ